MIEPNRIELTRLFALAERELHDAMVPGISVDGSFEHAYGAALSLATAAVRSERKRIHGPDHHRQTFDELGLVAGQRWGELAEYLQRSRKRRNVTAYDQVGTVSAAEAAELRESVAQFAAELRTWLVATCPEIAPD